MISNFYEKVSALANGGWSWCCHGLDAYSIIRNSFMAATLAFVCFAWWAKVYTKTRPTLPPGPRGLPIVGNLPFIKPDLHRYFLELSQIYGPIVKLQLGRKIWIVITSPSLAKEILKDHDVIFANRDPPVVAIMGTYDGSDMAWRPYGPEWCKLRRLTVHEILSKKSLDGCYALRQREVREMVKLIYCKVGSASPVNIGDQMFVTTLNVITSMLWGGSLDGEERSRLGIEFRQVVMEFIELLGAPNISDLFPFLTRFDLQGFQSRMKKASTWLDNILESMIAKKTKINQPERERKDFLRLLLELNQQGDYKSSLSIKEVKALLMDMVVAGTDSVSTTVEWTMTELLRHPDKIRRAVDELDKVVGNQNIVEESHLSQLVYLDAVIKETLRFHPAIPLLVPRRPSVACTVAGYTIPKDCRVIFNAWAMQRDVEYWEDDPLQFEPERFLKVAERGNYFGNNFHFLPFGSGRRICPGIPMAERMVKHVLAALLHSFEWTLPEGTKPDTREKFGIVLKKRELLVAIPTARLSNSELYE